ncbi:MAG: BON domain-containing protein [Sulfuriferula sp.]|nr:BON domain-containing protein [Sulfuriferula sp.]
MKNFAHVSLDKILEVTVLGFALTVSLIGIAHAASTPAPPDRSFEQYDINHDGIISASEAVGMGMLTRDFEAADTNRDGSLSKEEFASAEAVNDRLKILPPKSTSSIDDNKLTAKVEDALLKNTVLRGLRIHVESHAGIVALSGFASIGNKQLEIAQIATARVLASDVEGVHAVIVVA